MAENKKSTVKMRSIARKISVEWNFKKMFDFIVIDIIFAAAKIYLWRVMTEAEFFGRSYFDTQNLTLKGGFTYLTDVGLREMLESFSYWIPGSDTPVYAGNMLIETAVLSVVLISLEFLMILSGFVNGGKKVRRKLRPLNKLAQTAQLISTSDFEIDKFHDLESALEKIDAESGNSMVSTGNTELQGIENAINNLIDRMRKSYIQQARFVSDASHELRTPISVIQGYANMLIRWGKDDEKILDESINAIKSESEAMSRLVEQLLFLARGDNGKNQLVIEKICLTDMIHEIYDEYLMVDKEHVFEIAKGKDEPVYAFGDYAMLKQTARILVDNAVKYTPQGNEIIVSACTDENGIPCFEVQDYGTGIPSEDLPKVFERFYRSDDARNRKTGGTGLGLSIAKWIVDKHKGYFKVMSCVDVGTKFTVCLPQTYSQDNDSDGDNKENSQNIVA